MKKTLAFRNKKCYSILTERHPRGGIAQLVERLNGIQEVAGSNPTISTKTRKAVYF